MNNLAPDLVIKERKCQLGSLRNWRYCVGARLKFGSGAVFLTARDVSAVKSHSTTKQYRQLRRLQLGALYTASSNILCQTLVNP